jgi:chemotaxis protein MotB
MTLSFNRANSVAKFCMDGSNGLSKEKIAQLEELLTVNGRSYSDPVYKAGTTQVDMAASRRVEIKFRLKEDEMINKIAEILNQQKVWKNGVFLAKRYQRCSRQKTTRVS